MPNAILTLGGVQFAYRRPAKIIVDGDECDGYCDYKRKRILVRRDLSGAKEMETDLHETLHGAARYLDDDFAVYPIAKQQSVALRKLGYRKLTAAQLRTLGID